MAVGKQPGDRWPSGQQRLWAVVGLLVTVALAVVVIAFLVGNVRYLAGGAVGFAGMVAGTWRTVTKRGLGRVTGVIVAALGLTLLIVSLFRVGGNNGHTLVRLAVVAGLVFIWIVSSRRAVAPEVHGVVAGSIRHLARPSHPVLLCNPRSGGGKVEQFGLVALADSLGVEPVVMGPGDDLEQLARDAVARGADCLGMAGGDGSQALVASIAVEKDLPFVCIPAGTRNHFALDLGLDRDDPRKSIYAFRDAVERRVDYCTVNGRFFVNNVSLGVYATIVQEPAYREAKSETTRRLLPELLGHEDKPFDLQFTTPEGVEIDGSFLIMVSNNPYVLGSSLDVSQRRRLDSGRLGVFAVTATTGAQAAQVVGLALTHHRVKDGHVIEFQPESFEVRSRSGRALAGVDGEALDLETPLRFVIHPQGLRLVVPADNPAAAARRQARDVHLRDLTAIVAGHASLDTGPV